MRAPIWMAAALALCALAGCGDPLKTEYGKVDGDSVNGIAVLADYWGKRFAPTKAMRLSPHVDDTDLLLHVALAQAQPAADVAREHVDDRRNGAKQRHRAHRDPAADEERGDGLITGEACTWIEDWLNDRKGRQFVLVLRDGNVAPFLCERWAQEAEAEAARGAPEAADALRDLAMRLRGRGWTANEPPALEPGKTATCRLFRVRGGKDDHPRLLDDGSAAPLAMLMRSSPEADDAETLIAADHRPFAIAVPIGDSRLIVVANATPLLDGAQVDPAARALLRRLSDEIAGWKPKSSAWVQRLAVRQGDPEPPNMLAMLFGKPPFSYVAFHLLAVALAVLAWKSAWLGRVASRDARVLERFSRHVDALAFHLRRVGAFAACAAAVAKQQRRPLPRQPRDAEDALALVADLHRTAGGGPQRAPATPAGSAG